ncbi:hypothetical protein QLQ12_41635 [Actinoplanes sp. NEAU-A12]|uniref:PIN domain-containing protein n=1 Tax=Actinoplanes sandaracinus TaxID=3045177 RepID=A0ABT6WZC2_9ACTN|nr:hypothetical protein [Actinoplanes sandaracinus]MDI6105107.1 hypothetical protein [Actinoplanes sandaracinus]
MSRNRRPRILDASALVELFSGHSTLMRLLDLANGGHALLAVPTLAIAEAQAVLDAPPSHWNRILALPGIRAMDLAQHIAVEIGGIAAPRLQNHPVHTALIGPLMTAQVLYEAKTMNAAIITSVPEAYGGHEVAIQPI